MPACPALDRYGRATTTPLRHGRLASCESPPLYDTLRRRFQISGLGEKFVADGLHCPRLIISRHQWRATPSTGARKHSKKGEEGGASWQLQDPSLETRTMESCHDLLGALSLFIQVGLFLLSKVTCLESHEMENSGCFLFPPPPLATGVRSKVWCLVPRR